MITFAEDNVWLHFSYRIRHLDALCYTNMYFLNYVSTTTTSIQALTWTFSMSSFAKNAFSFMQTFPWKLEISRAVTQYSTTEMLSCSSGELGISGSSLHSSNISLQRFAVSIPVWQEPAIQAGYICYFKSNICKTGSVHFTKSKMLLWNLKKKPKHYTQKTEKPKKWSNKTRNRKTEF